MNINKKILSAVMIISQFFTMQICFANEQVTPFYKYPDYSYMFNGNDKFEKFNRKVFKLNNKFNKYALRPIHTVWTSILPEYVIDRIHSATLNIEYPIRLISTLIQRDFKSAGTETVRFAANTTVGLGGLYDPAKSVFKIEPVSENMEQALAKCHVKQGPYMVVPVISSTSPRNITGRIFDTALNPSSYIATPILAMIKAGLFINKSYTFQPLVKMVESNFADPYDIARKIYGIDNYIKCTNLDRKKNLFDAINAQNSENTEETVNNTDNSGLNIFNASNENSEKELTVSDIIKGGASIDNLILKSYNTDNANLLADIVLFDYKPQSPIVDAMRTVLFDFPEINNSIWSEISLWNRSFSRRIKTSSINMFEGRENYKFRYILQKDKNSPLAIIYPSIGESMSSHHSVVLAKLFYDEGYSVVMPGSHFQWEFVKSMPDDYRPGIPSKDAELLHTLTVKMVESLQNKYSCQFGDKVVIGTSFGAMMTMFIADIESRNNMLGNAKFISINPPIELLYAMRQIDKNNEDWNKRPYGLKEKAGLAAAKVLYFYNNMEKIADNSDNINLPVTDEEGKLITGFIMHQKLSDLIYTIEHGAESKNPEKIYAMINNMNFEDYAKKYLLSDENNSTDNLSSVTSLWQIKDYLQNNDNYKIYHTLDDYLVNGKQLKELKSYTGNKTVLFSNGSHLGCLYRKEFLDELKKDITLTKELAAVQ